MWNNVVKPKVKGGEKKVTLPSELPPEPATPAPKATSKLEPGVYLDEDSGKYYRINKDGTMEELK